MPLISSKTSEVGEPNRKQNKPKSIECNNIQGNHFEMREQINLN